MSTRGTFSNDFLCGTCIVFCLSACEYEIKMREICEVIRMEFSSSSSSRISLHTWAAKDEFVVREFRWRWWWWRRRRKDLPPAILHSWMRWTGISIIGGMLVVIIHEVCFILMKYELLIMNCEREEGGRGERRRDVHTALEMQHERRRMTRKRGRRMSRASRRYDSHTVV